MLEQKRKYYSVKCKCGHADSRNYYIPVEFGVIAGSKKEAAEKGRWIPRCKHHHKDCVLEVRELTRSEFIELNKKNNLDPYLKCHSIQDQRKIDLSDRLVLETNKHTPYKKDKENSAYMYGKKNIRHPKQYMKNVLKMQEAYCYQHEDFKRFRCIYSWGTNCSKSYC